MIKTVFTLILSLSFVGCGSYNPRDWIIGEEEDEEYTPPETQYPEPEQTAPPESEMPSSLKYYVDAFVVDAGRYGIDVGKNAAKLRSVKFGETKDEENPNRIGVCYTWTYNDGTLAYADIVVEYPKKFDIGFKALMYHELGHCVLLRDHDDQHTGNMMAPTMHSNSYYNRCWDEILEELFTYDPIDCD